MNEIMRLVEAVKNCDQMYREADNEKLSYELRKNGNHISLEIELKDEEFDDSEIMESIGKFNELIDNMDDDLFQQAAALIGETTDLKRLDDLLEKEHLTEEEAGEAKEMLETATQVIGKLLIDRIREAFDLHN